MFNPMDFVTLANDLGIIQGVRDKRVQQKDPAAEKLADVLGELAKGVGALDDGLCPPRHWTASRDTLKQTASDGQHRKRPHKTQRLIWQAGHEPGLAPTCGHR